MDLKTLGAIFLIILLFNLFFFGVPFGIAWGFLFLILNTYYFFIQKKNDNLQDKTIGVICSILAVLFGFLISFRGNEIVQFVDFALASFLSTAALTFYKRESKFNFNFLRFILLPGNLFFNSLQALFNQERENIQITPGHKESQVGLFRGIAIAIPIFLVLLFILMQADPAFSKLVSDVFRNIGERLVISLILFTGLFWIAMIKFIDIFKDKSENKNAPLGKVHELSIILGSIITLFTIFIVVQFQYLFSTVGERQLHELGIKSLTFSEYINKGFFELLVASSIASIVLMYVFHSLFKIVDSKRKIVQIFSAILTIETGLLLLSAAKRDIMYADEHGLTRARIIGFIFLVWLSLILLIFLVRTFKNLKNITLFYAFSFVTLLAVLVLNFVNIDNLIASDFKPTVNKETDYTYISSLSADASEGWKDALGDAYQVSQPLIAKTDLSADEARKLYYAHDTLSNLNWKIELLVNKYGNTDEIIQWYKTDKPIEWEKFAKSKNEADLPGYIKRDRHWQGFNLSEYFAYNKIIENKNQFFMIPELRRVSIERYDRIPDYVKNSIQFDRSQTAPLTN